MKGHSMMKLPSSTLRPLAQYAPVQRSGNLADPYDGGYPITGLATTPVPHNDNTFYWSPTMQQFGRGLMAPLYHAAEGGSKTIQAFSASVNNAAIITGAVGATVLLMNSLSKQESLRGAAGLAALGASTYYGVRTLGQALDQTNTGNNPKGDWPQNLGTTLAYGTLGYWGVSSNVRNHRRGPRNWFGIREFPQQVKESVVGVWEGLMRSPHNTAEAFGRIFKP
jgi:hypothetical protein